MNNLTKRIEIFGYPVDITTKEEAVNFAFQRMLEGQGMQVVTINPEMITAADKTPKLAEIIRSAGLIIPDSVGIELAMRRFGVPNAKRLPGIEFSEELMRKCEENELKVAFLGGDEETISRLKPEIAKKYPQLNVVFVRNGYFKEEETSGIIEQLKEADANLVFVGMGSPRQEYFIHTARPVLDKAIMVGVGGSFDVWAKKIKRAPWAFRVLGLEWFYRLITMPERFNRMFPVLPLFLLRILLSRT
jgi:N-acetylglucosaminyldiphosphoundecaprenol N-acetyl-beta-D-mannosaminyltransferase